jgi:hypothetical protein
LRAPAASVGLPTEELWRLLVFPKRDATPVLFRSRPKAQRLMLSSSQHGPQSEGVEGKRDGDQDWSRRARLRVQYLKDPPLSKRNDRILYATENICAAPGSFRMLLSYMTFVA